MLGLQTSVDVATTATDTAPVAVQEKTLSIMELILDGGMGSIIIISILFVMLAVALFLYFERLFAIKAASKMDKTFMYKIRDCISAGRLDAAKMLCVQSNTPVARLIEKGVSRIGKPLEDINKAIENAGTLEVYNLEKNTAILATIAGAGYVIPRNGFSRRSGRDGVISKWYLHRDDNYRSGAYSRNYCLCRLQPLSSKN